MSQAVTHKKQDGFQRNNEIRNPVQQKRIMNLKIKPSKENQFKEFEKSERKNAIRKVHSMNQMKIQVSEPEIHYEKRKPSYRQSKHKAIKKGITKSEWDIRSIHSVGNKANDHNYAFDIHSVHSVEDNNLCQDIQFSPQNQRKNESIRKVESYLHSQEIHSSLGEDKNYEGIPLIALNNNINKNLSVSLDRVAMVNENKRLKNNNSKYIKNEVMDTSQSVQSYKSEIVTRPAFADDTDLHINRISEISHNTKSVDSKKRHSPASHSSLLELETGSKKVEDLQMHIDKIAKINDDTLSIKSNSMIMEDQWTEYHSLPSHASVIEIEKKQKTSNTFNVNLDQIESVNDNASIKSNSVIMEDKWVEYHPIPDDNESVKSGSVIMQDNWVEYRSIPTNKCITVIEEDLRSIKSGSVIMEDEWIEYHKIQNMPTNKCTKVIEDDLISIKSGSVLMEDEWTEYQKVPFYTSSINTVIQTGENSDALDLVDHYSYRYENPTKTEQISNLTNVTKVTLQTNPYSLDTRPQLLYDSMRRHQRPILPSTDCMTQTFHIDHENEELLEAPTIYDAQGNLIRNLYETNNFKSITENVTLQVRESIAVIKIIITIEMYHNFKPVSDIWKRKTVTLTRTIELDLDKIKDNKKLKDIINRCNLNQTQVSWRNSNGGITNQYENESRLEGEDIFVIFTTLLDITRREEQKNRSNAAAMEDFYLTSGPGGQLTSVAVEPQYLISGYKGHETSYLYY